MSSLPLIEKFKNKDERAFREIYDMFFSYLKYFSFKITKDIDEANDIAITALEAAFEKPEEFESIEKLKAYLSIVVKNKSLKYLKAQIRHQNTGSQVAYLLSDNYEDYIEAQLVKAEALSIIHKNISRLPPTRRKVFEMLYIDGLSNQEVAVILNMKPSAVYVNKLKALKDLRCILFDNKLL